MSREISIIAFPCWTCTTLAHEISDRFHVNSETDTSSSIEEPLPNSNTIVLIFPIRGDDQIPQKVSEWLFRVTADKTVFLIICGDFPREPVRNDSVFWEVNRILNDRNVRLPEPIYVPTPVNDVSNTSDMAYRYIQNAIMQVEANRIQLPHAKLGRPHTHASKPSWYWRDPKLQTSYIEAGETTDNVQKIATLLESKLMAVVDQDDRCCALSLASSEPYPRGLMPTDPNKRRRLFELLYELEYLVELSMPFCGNIEIQMLPPNVSRLDLRGSPLSNWDVLCKSPQLKFLNLAACDLESVPASIRSIASLTALHLYKNRLTDLPKWLDGLVNLEYLMLYRNQLVEFPKVVNNCQCLRGLNIGANRIKFLPQEIANLNHLEVLGLRLLPLEGFPIVLRKLHSLKTIDLSGTSFNSEAEKLLPNLKVTSNLPKWW